MTLPCSLDLLAAAVVSKIIIPIHLRDHRWMDACTLIWWYNLFQPFIELVLGSSTDHPNVSFILSSSLFSFSTVPVFMSSIVFFFSFFVIYFSFNHNDNSSALLNQHVLLEFLFGVLQLLFQLFLVLLNVFHQIPLALVHTLLDVFFQTFLYLVHA